MGKGRDGGARTTSADSVREAPPERSSAESVQAPPPRPSPIEGEGDAHLNLASTRFGNGPVRFPGVVRRARRLRKQMTLPEKLLWAELGKIPLHVRKQAPVGRYIADFIIHDCKLVIEVDGLRHSLPEEELHDAERDAWFSSQGYRTLRVTNVRVLEDMDGVLADIQAAVLSPPSPTLVPSSDGKAE